MVCDRLTNQKYLVISINDGGHVQLNEAIIAECMTEVKALYDKDQQHRVGPAIDKTIEKLMKEKKLPAMSANDRIRFRDHLLDEFNKQNLERFVAKSSSTLVMTGRFEERRTDRGPGLTLMKSRERTGGQDRALPRGDRD